MRTREPHDRVGRRAGLLAVLAWLTRRQMVGTGLVGAAVPLVLLGAALGALERVELAHADVAQIAEAQASFQDADMAHDAIRADVLTLLLLPAAEVTPEAARAALERDIADFEQNPRAVERVGLTTKLGADLDRVRPLQEEGPRGPPGRALRTGSGGHAGGR